MCDAPLASKGWWKHELVYFVARAGTHGSRNGNGGSGFRKTQRSRLLSSFVAGGLSGRLLWRDQTPSTDREVWRRCCPIFSEWRQEGHFRSFEGWKKTRQQAGTCVLTGISASGGLPCTTVGAFPLCRLWVYVWCNASNVGNVRLCLSYARETGDLCPAARIDVHVLTANQRMRAARLPTWARTHSKMWWKDQRDRAVWEVRGRQRRVPTLCRSPRANCCFQADETALLPGGAGAADAHGQDVARLPLWCCALGRGAPCCRLGCCSFPPPHPPTPPRCDRWLLAGVSLESGIKGQCSGRLGARAARAMRRAGRRACLLAARRSLARRACKVGGACARLRLAVRAGVVWGQVKATDTVPDSHDKTPPHLALPSHSPSRLLSPPPSPCPSRQLPAVARDE